MKNLKFIAAIALLISCSDNSIEPSEPNLFVAPPVNRTTQSIVLTDEMTAEMNKTSFDLDFYRNKAYNAGLSTEDNPEYYSFLVINPGNNPDASAPLWVFLHGGAQGYFDEQGNYQTYQSLDEDRHNHEESFDKLWWHITFRTIKNGQIIDNTLKRRIEEGYRILVVSYSDHDWYSGLGTPYPNNPASPNAEVNGLQATMAAIDYTAANYPTTHAWVHGTSAGSIGSWSVALSYSQEGRPITGLIADSGALNENFDPIFDTYLGSGQLPYSSTWRPEGIQEKVGFFADLDNQVHPESQIGTYNFRATPGIWIAGLADPAWAAHLDPVAEATTAGFSNNLEYILSSLDHAINEQVNSPHELHFLPNTGHVPTHSEGPVNDIVNDFMEKVLATNPTRFGL